MDDESQKMPSVEKEPESAVETVNSLSEPTAGENTPVTASDSGEVLPTSDSASVVVSTKKHRRLLVGLVTAAVGVLVVVGLTAAVYLKPVNDPLVRRIVQVVPFPSALVGGKPILFRDFLEERDALVNYFSIAGSEETKPSETELSANIIDTLINKAAIERIANVRGIAFDEDRAAAFYQDVISSSGEEAFTTQLSQTFGWSPDEFKARVVHSLVLAMQVGEWIADDTETQAEARATAQTALDRVNAGEDFAIVAGDSSKHPSSVNGGDIGYVKESELPEDWGSAVKDLEVGAHSDIIDTSDAFVIFLLTDRVQAGEDTELKFSVILTPKKTLDDVVSAYLDSVKVWRFVGKS